MFTHQQFKQILAITIQQLQPGPKAPGVWVTIGKSTSWEGAKRAARFAGGPAKYGGERHPDGGPLYGTVRAVTRNGVYWWNPVTENFEPMPELTGGEGWET